MNILDTFKIASGSIIGTSHQKMYYNNQDSYIIRENLDQIVAIVCDGCGSGHTSEVGSILGSSIVCNELINANLNNLKDDKKEIEKKLEEVNLLILNRIKTIVDNVGLPMINTIGDSFLFTIVACIIGNDYTYIISFGDGFYAINGNINEIGPYEENAPPYISYGLVKNCIKKQIDLKFDIHRIIPTSKINSLLIATDGVSDFLSLDSKFGSLNQFWENDIYFSDEVAISKKLAFINKSDNYYNLRDDTTIISIKRQ